MDSRHVLRVDERLGDPQQPLLARERQSGQKAAPPTCHGARLSTQRVNGSAAHSADAVEEEPAESVVVGAPGRTNDLKDPVRPRAEAGPAASTADVEIAEHGHRSALRAQLDHQRAAGTRSPSAGGAVEVQRCIPAVRCSATGRRCSFRGRAFLRVAAQSPCSSCAAATPRRAAGASQAAPPTRAGFEKDTPPAFSSPRRGCGGTPATA
jgi:hypothetical protein